MRLDGLLKPIKNSTEFNEIIENIKNKKTPIGVYGISDSGRGYLLCSIFDSIDNSIFLITHSDVEARNLYEDISFYIPEVYYFPTKEVAFYNVYAISGDLRWERLKVIKEMINPGKKIIILTAESLASAYIPVELYDKFSFSYKVGDNLNLSELGEKLVQCGYERNDMVEGKGQFSVRGGILDIYSPVSAFPIRVELFGDEIDSIRSFSTESQRSIEKVDSLDIFPAKEIILDKEKVGRGIENINKDLEYILDKLKKNKEASKNLKTAVNSNIESLNENWNFEDIEGYIPYFYKNTSSFFEFMNNSLVIVDDAQRCNGKLDSVYYEFNDNYNSFLERGNILPRQGELLISKDSIFQKLDNYDLVTIDAISKSNKVLKPNSIINFSQISLQNYHGQLDMLIQEIKSKKALGYRTVILSGTRPRGERLVDTLRDKGIESLYSDKLHEINPGQVVITFGNQLRGFEYPSLKLSVISDKEVFGDYKRKTQKHNKSAAGKIKSFTELKPGDYVVHTNYGIGIYKGIKHIDMDGHKRDYLELSYAAADKLYVPVEQLDMVQKYIGSEGNSPKITKLGGTEWVKTKNKVRNSINEIAQDLLKLYATRATMKGYKFSKDTVWQKQFEGEFPYEETPDQLLAIEDIKQDMESDKAMDRLLCGDVGYGKTEVAIRAAFKAVLDGKQVAFLVPTTILAEQHYNNFIQRFSDFPVKVDMVSRFRTPAQQKNTLKEVKAGNVDILIGTHRILQKDILFKDLGLLIIDEEQRFGVTHKEKIKDLKKNIDVLTLSATPIPRTLHMSLVGVRDISIIETPPEERYPVQTYVVEYNDQLIKDAIMREVNRGGQVYFLYNRVETIRDMASYISKLVPDVNVAVAHGQMTERELEKVMLEFMQNKFHVLICTTIIETGIDIPNVNTIIIYDADKMGLSQLYQLRGRVGRSNRIAYSYLTYKKDKVLTEVAEKRLKAIKDFTELGSGFKIALKDLEIRGAGNMMGSSQHGHMAAVGYDLYCRMLEETIKLMTGEISNESVETSVELKVDAYIPGTYIEDEVQKIEIYKRIAAIEGKEDVLEIQEELMDRFSDIPNPVLNLIEISYVRSIAKGVGIEDITQKNQEVRLQFQSKNWVTENMIKALLKKYSRSINFKDMDKPLVTIKLLSTKKDNIINFIKEFVVFIKDNV